MKDGVGIILFFRKIFSREDTNANAVIIILCFFSHLRSHALLYSIFFVNASRKYFELHSLHIEMSTFKEIEIKKRLYT